MILFKICHHTHQTSKVLISIHYFSLFYEDIMKNNFGVCLKSETNLKHSLVTNVPMSVFVFPKR